jgi:predicted phosphoribosyltransferase
MVQRFQNAENPILFSDRDTAGAHLAQAVLKEIQMVPQPYPRIVYALPRGGLPIALPVARSLECPLEVLVAKKITRPSEPELAIGAVTADGHVLQTSSRLSIGSEEWQEAVKRAQAKAQQQLAHFAQHPQIGADGAIALLVDDGIATGMTIAVAAKALREQHPREIWICAPVVPASMINVLKHWCDRAIVLATPTRFLSVSRFYQSFPQLSTEEALAYLKKSTQA